jgi:hypothetical protein
LFNNSPQPLPRGAIQIPFDAAKNKRRSNAELPKIFHQTTFIPQTVA